MSDLIIKISLICLIAFGVIFIIIKIIKEYKYDTLINNVEGNSIIFTNENKKYHNESGAAVILMPNGEKFYYLNGDYYGSNLDFPTDEYWIKYQKLIVFS